MNKLFCNLNAQSSFEHWTNQPTCWFSFANAQDHPQGKCSLCPGFLWRYWYLSRHLWHIQWCWSFGIVWSYMHVKYAVNYVFKGKVHYFSCVAVLLLLLLLLLSSHHHHHCTFVFVITNGVNSKLLALVRLKYLNLWEKATSHEPVYCINPSLCFR